MNFFGLLRKYARVFQNNPKEVFFLNQDFKRKHQTLLTGICSKWFLNHMNNPKPPIKISIFTKANLKWHMIIINIGDYRFIEET